MFAARRVRSIALSLSSALIVATAGCGEVGDAADELALSTAAQPLEAFCSAEVQGTGSVDVETDYLPHVVNCENGGADFAALQAQAVAARTYLYYKLARQGNIGDGTGDQVFSCGREPGQQHRDAVNSTAGQVLRYQGTTIAAFFVAGAIPSEADCHANGGDNDPTGTEHFVTYNEGRSGDGLEQTSLGWVNPGNLANRGCQSQNGANCLSQHGYTYDRILHYYYGEDIELVTAEGACVNPPPPPPPPDPDAAPPPPPPPPPDPDAAPLPAPDAAPTPTADAAPAPPTDPDLGAAIDARPIESDAGLVDEGDAGPLAPQSGPSADSMRGASFKGTCQAAGWEVNALPLAALALVPLRRRRRRRRSTRLRGPIRGDSGALVPPPTP